MMISVIIVSLFMEKQLIKQIYDFSNHCQKLHLLQFSGENNGDAFMDRILQVESVFEYKNYSNPKWVLLTITKLKKGVVLKFSTTTGTIKLVKDHYMV